MTLNALARRVWAGCGIALAGSLAATAMVASPAVSQTVVLHPDDLNCNFAPGDVPGVDVSFPAQCTIVTTSRGWVTVAAKGRLPKGYSVSTRVVAQMPCLGATGRVVANPSGRVSAVCHLQSWG
jgi:hypothetical protein